MDEDLNKDEERTKQKKNPKPWPSTIILTYVLMLWNLYLG